ncbi:MAG: zinc-binding alcohol dehydrogenase family protein [Thiohalomonadales bacterium]
MRAIAYYKSLPISDSNALVDIDIDPPSLSARDLLVKIEAISVNPVDTKIRTKVSPSNSEFKILGWDAAGTVTAVGEQVSLFNKGDEVWYAGAIDRAGANSEYHVVDERIVSKKPESLTFDRAAALPLTSITAWEILFDRLKVHNNSSGTLLVIGAAGGVGSMIIQLAKQLTKLKVIASASRPETISWVKSLGADFVINHNNSLSEELKSLGVGLVEYVAGLNHTENHLDEIVKVIAPQGKFAVIDDPQSLDIMPFKTKSISIHWELMFTRSLFETKDMIEQHNLLEKIANMVDRGEIKSTLREHLGEINAANLVRAHTLLESGKSIGKIVLSGFS